jgi:hypothetical protein
VLYKILEEAGIASSVLDVGYRFESCRIGVQVPASQIPDLLWGPPSLLSTCTGGGRVKLNTNIHYSTGVKNTIWALVTWCLIKYRDFTFKYLAPHQNPLLQECKKSPLHYTGNSDKTLYTIFEVLTAVNIKKLVFCDLTSRNQIHGFSTINVEAGLSPEFLVPMQEPTGSHIPEFPLP